MTRLNTDPVGTTSRFFDNWNAGRYDDAVAMLDENVVYDNVPLPNIEGRRAVEEFHRGFGIGRDYEVSWKVTLIAVVGDVVLNERLDTYRHKSGKEFVIPVMGTMTVLDGFITVWRDYFDLSTFEAKVAAIEG